MWSSYDFNEFYIHVVVSKSSLFFFLLRCLEANYNSHLGDMRFLISSVSMIYARGRRFRESLSNYRVSGFSAFFFFFFDRGVNGLASRFNTCLFAQVAVRIDFSNVLNFEFFTAVYTLAIYFEFCKHIFTHYVIHIVYDTNFSCSYMTVLK